MATPRTGETHDLVFHVNDSVSVGAIVRPGTYRVAIAPQFLPRLSVGDPRGIDDARWRSYIQSRFDGGAGQVYFSASQANNRFAESNLVDIGLPMTVIGGMAGRADPLTAASVPGGPMDDDPVGDIMPALMPRNTTVEAEATALLFTNRYPVHVLEMSNRPHLFHYQSHLRYDSLAGVDVFKDGALKGERTALSGNWLVENTQIGVVVVDAVMYSGVAILAGTDGMRVFGSADGVAAASFYEPPYSTNADVVHVYDSKVWRGQVGRMAYFDPDTRVWSGFYRPGDPAVPIVNIETAFGKEFIGKEDSLWVFDKGLVYEIENYRDEREPNNFKLMVVHRGALYYNIRQRIYRVTSGNLIELLATPDFNGVVEGGTSIGNELHFLIREPTGEGRVWIFNSETGGTRQWFGTEDIAIGRATGAERSPSSIVGAFGHIWISPMMMTVGYSSLSTIPVSVVNRLNPAEGVAIPYFAKDRSYLITSMTDQGYPNKDKLYNAAVIDYLINGPSEKIDVSYITEVKSARLTHAILHETGTQTDILDDVNDGDPDTSAAMTNTAGLVTLYMGFDEPVEAIRLVMGSTAAGVRSDDATKWVMNNPPQANGFLWILDGSVPQRIQDGTGQLLNDGIVYLGDLKKQGWVKSNVAGTGGGDAYWIMFLCYDVNDIVDIAVVDGIRSLRSQNWATLGTITEQSATQARLPYPNNTIARYMMLKLEPYGTAVSRPEIKRIEYEYAPTGTPLKVIHGLVDCGDDLELLNLTKENSGEFVQASLYSMAHAGLTYTIQVPAPGPVGHTIRAMVAITDPGGAFSILSYPGRRLAIEPGLHSISPAEIPIRLDEM